LPTYYATALWASRHVPVHHDYAAFTTFGHHHDGLYNKYHQSSLKTHIMMGCNSVNWSPYYATALWASRHAPVHPDEAASTTVNTIDVLYMRHTIH
jgi:hypothetical protein